MDFFEETKWPIIVCVASGPSLCDYDLAYLDKMRWKCGIITANRAHEAVLRKDIVYAADQKWWIEYNSCVSEDCIKVTLRNVALRLTRRRVHDVFGVDWTKEKTPTHDKEIFHGSNSGQHCIDLARLCGAKKIILLGFDFQHTGGKAHFHPDYPKGFVNASNVEQWLEHIDYVCDYTINHYGIDLVNCSRETAITSCRRSTLRKELK